MKVIIDGKTIEAEENKTILELARAGCVLFRSKVRKDTHHHAVFILKMEWK